MRWASLLFLLLLIIPISLSTTTNYTCDGKTLVKTTQYDSGIKSIERQPCQYGCANGSCLNPSDSVSVLKIAIIFLFIMLLTPVIIMYYHNNFEFPTFAALIFIIMALMFFLIGVYGNIIGLSYYNLSYSMSVVSALLASFFGMIIIKTWLDNKNIYGGDIFDNQ